MTRPEAEALARRVIAARGAPFAVTMSTIEAESGFRNVLGEYAAWSAQWGAGFGQVHLRWHLATFRQVAAELGVTLPEGLTERRDAVQRYVKDNIILANPELSMHLAVEVIRRTWMASGGDFDRFLAAYVGAGIPKADRRRRWELLRRWQGVEAAERAVAVLPVDRAQAEREIGIAVLAVAALIAAAQR